MTRTGPPRTGLALACLSVGVAGLAVTVALTPWGLLPVPLALVVGVAAWLGADLRTTAEVVGRSGDDPGAGPAGLTP